MQVIEIYTDGGCRGNQEEINIGGYGVVLIFGRYMKELYGSKDNTTNNEMELTAALEGLKAIKMKYKHQPVILQSDSIYVIKGMREWLKNWKKNGWKTAKKQPIANLELWKAMDLEMNLFDNLKVKHIKGHNGHRFNERADALANKGMDERSVAHECL